MNIRNYTIRKLDNRKSIVYPSREREQLFFSTPYKDGVNRENQFT
jgi:hypothetical protein